MIGQKTNRIMWIDIVKGIAILSVVLYHTGFLPLQKQLLPLITSYMLPIFCVIGGYVYSHQENQIVFLVKKIKSLILPYFIAGIVSFTIWFVLINISSYQVIRLDPQDQLIQFLLGKNLIFNGPLWFLVAFFLSNIIFYFIYILINNRSIFLQAGLPFFLFITSYVINLKKIHYPYSFDLALSMVSFFIMGNVIKNYWRRITKKYIIGLFFLLFVLLSFKNGIVDVYGRLYGNPILFWFNAIFGSLLVMFFSYFISKQKSKINLILEYLGKNSLFILVVHWPIMQWTTYILKSIGVLELINGKPELASFSYYISNKYIFTLVEIPLLIIYTLVPILFVLLLDKSKTCVLKYVQV